jgi:hypothetical protein
VLLCREFPNCILHLLRQKLLAKGLICKVIDLVRGYTRLYRPTSLEHISDVSQGHAVSRMMGAIQTTMFLKTSQRSVKGSDPRAGQLESKSRLQAFRTRGIARRLIVPGESLNPIVYIA